MTLTESGNARSEQLINWARRALEWIVGMAVFEVWTCFLIVLYYAQVNFNAEHGMS